MNKIEVSIEEAYKITKKYSTPVKDTEMVMISEAVGRVLGENIYAGFDNPPFDRSPLDGYAVIAVDTEGASEEKPAVLDVVGEIFAGMSYQGCLKEGQVVRIMTGAPMPDGSDCVIKQEDTDYGMETVSIYRGAAAYQNFCYAGEDFKKNQCLLECGKKLVFTDIGILASAGLTEVCVYRRPRIAVVSTGDEIMAPGRPLVESKIYNSNMYMLIAGVKSCGAEVVFSVQAGDSEEDIRKALKAAVEKADIIVTTGGVSVGKKDLLPVVITEMGGRIMFNRVSIKPGSPTTFSIIENKPVLSLSGSPFGAAVNFNVLLKPMIAGAGRDESLESTSEYAVFRGSFRKASPKTRFVRAFLKDGVVAQPEGLNSNGVIGNMGICNCYIEIPAGTPDLSDGQTVKVIQL